MKPLNALLAIVILYLILTALLRNWIPYGVFRVIHPLGGYLLTVLIGLHVYLNRNWIRQQYFKRK